MFKIGCHVSAAGGVFNAPKNAADLGCETFQIFTRPPMGGPAPKLTDEIVAKFKEEMEKYYPSTPTPSPFDKLRVLPLSKGETLRGVAKLEDNGGASPPSLRRGGRAADGVVGATFVVHCPYIVNLGSSQPRIYHGTLSIMGDELKRANILGAKYVMTHLGSFKDLGREKGMAQAKKGLVEVLKKYEGETKFLLEIAAGSGEVIGASFEVLAELMEPLVKFKTFGGICFDTQHAFASGYDIRDDKSVAETFKQFDKVIGLKYLRMSHINDSKIELGGKKDRHDHIGDGKIGEAGFLALLKFFSRNLKPSPQPSPPPSPRLRRTGRGGGRQQVATGALSLDMPLIFETEHDKVKKDIEILKKLRNKI